MRRFHRSITMLSWVLACAGIAGCQRAATQQDRSAMDWVTLGAPAPVSSTSTRGLEVQMLIVKNEDYAVARALSGYADASPVIDPDDAARWRAWGFRWTAVPIGELNEVLGVLSPMQPPRVQWLGEFSQWRAIVRAGTIDGQRVRVGDGESMVRSGKPRLIARSWIQPMMGDGGIHPGVRTDLALQLELPSSNTMAWAVDVDGLPMIDDAGPVLGGLLAGIHADGTHALLLVADSPDRDWAALPDEIRVDPQPGNADQIGPDANEVETEPTPDPDARVQNGSHTEGIDAAAGSRASIGPELALRKTLGERIFSTTGSGPRILGEVYDPPRSVVVVLIPRVEGGFGLLPKMIEGKEPE